MSIPAALVRLLHGRHGRHERAGAGRRPGDRKPRETTQEALMAKFLILSRGTGEAYKQLSPQEMQKVIQKYMAWTDDMRKAGRLLHADKLRADGRVGRGGHGRMTGTDSPYVAHVEHLVRHRTLEVT